MKFSVAFPLVIATVVTVFAQTPAPATTAPKPRPAATQAKPTAGPAATGKPAATTPKPAAAKPTGAAKAKPVETGKVVLTVGDEKITEKEFETFIDSLPEQYRTQARGPMKRQMAEQIVRVKMLSGEARKRGLDKDAATKARIRFQEDNLLAGAAFTEIQNGVKVDDAAVLKYYNEHKNEYESVKARHILIKFKGSPVPTKEGKPELTEEQSLAKVQELRKQILAGGDFAALAKAESDDTGSGNNGGELGSFSKGQMVPEFEAAAFSMKPGDLSEPIKTQFGYHLIKVDEHEVKALDSLKEEIGGKLKPESARQAVEDMRKSVKVVMDDAYFGPEQIAPPAGAPTPAPVK